jgi:RNA polymerase sigma-70 factor, ECF subfamily
VVRNKAVDTFRHETATSSRDVHDEAAAEQIPAPQRTDSEAERRADIRQVRGALGSLSSDQRHVVELAYFGGFSHSQIAELLELPMGTVKGRRRLALTKLRLALGAHAEVAS